MTAKQSERDMVRDLARIWLDRADAGLIDPDADPCAMSRQYLRALEKIERMTEMLREQERLALSRESQSPFLHRVAKELADVWPKAIR
jgi:hypothetical protein